MKKIIKEIKKLKLQKGDILVINSSFTFMPEDIKCIQVYLKTVDKHIPTILFTHPDDFIRYEKPTEGRHKVYLNNLEYLEYLSNKKGLDK